MAAYKFTPTKDKIAALIKLDIPVLIWGPPGGGKSSIVKAIAEENGWKYYELMGNTLEPTDVTGPREKITFQDDPGKVYSIGCEPAWVHDFRDPDHPGILFIDELCTCSIPTMNALLRIVLDRKVGEVPIYCKIVAATNCGTDTLGNNPLQQALANRFCHIDMDESDDEWVEGMRNGFAGEAVKDIGGPVDDPDARIRAIDMLKKFADSRVQVPRLVDRNWKVNEWPADMNWPAAQEDEIKIFLDYAFPTRRSLSQAIRVFAMLDGKEHALTEQLVCGLIGLRLGNPLCDFAKKFYRNLNP